MGSARCEHQATGADPNGQERLAEGDGGAEDGWLEAEGVVKPEGPVARRTDYVVEACPHAEAAALIESFHYAKGASNTSVHAHCLRRVADGETVGAALWMPPTANAAKGLAKRFLANAARHREVLVLSRLVVAPGEPKNAAGMLLGKSERLVRRDPRWSLFATYADPLQGHTGTIYRATNWQPAGETKPETVWVDPTGRQRARLATRTKTVGEMIAAGFVRAGKSRKLRFVKVVRTQLAELVPERLQRHAKRRSDLRVRRLAQVATYDTNHRRIA